MNSNNLIVREYLSTLKEDNELDFLFPILLNIMGFRIIQTAKESKGQSQYGKDIIAIGIDENGNKCRYYFELKGFKDKDIDDRNYSVKDGIRESLIEAKDTAFNDSSIPKFNTLPVKIVLVHNGVLKANIRPTFEGFISKEFKEGEFERWDIYHLTDIFSEFLFSEYILSDEQSNVLLKKTLAFLDTPDYDYNDFKKLVFIQFDKITIVKGRAFNKLFASLNLLQTLILHYSKENNNLIAAKECSKFLIISTWSWILKMKFETKRPIINEFQKLSIGHFEIFNDYFKKTFPTARITAGLFAENGAVFEKVGYPLRCFEYLDDILHYCRMRLSHPNLKSNNSKYRAVKNKQKDLLIGLINNNSGFQRPIIDNQSIGIMQLFLFFAEKTCLRQKDIEFIASYIFSTINNLLIERLKFNITPELYNNIELVVEAYAHSEIPDEYCNTSSILFENLLEILIILDNETSYQEIKKYLNNEVSLQLPLINFEEHDVEQLLFEKNLHGEYHVDCIQELPAEFSDFKDLIKKQQSHNHIYRTDKSGLSYLRYLAHSYYKNELMPDEWRIHFPIEELKNNQD